MFDILFTFLFLKLADGEFDSDLGDEEIDEELALPLVLVDIGYNEKKELLRFKRTHNEVILTFKT